MGIIFDLDQTIIDSRIAKEERDNRNWRKVYDLIPQMKPYTQIVNFIKYAVGKGIEVAIVTSSPRAYCEKVLEYLEIRDVITVCYHDTEKHKPNPEPLKLAISKMKNQENKNIIAIGDEEKDIIAANSIPGVISVLAYWGNYTSFVNSQVRPDIFCRDEETLLRYFLSKGLECSVYGLRKKEEHIYYMYDYYPISKKHDNLSQEVFNETKGRSDNKDILDSFCRCFLKKKIPKKPYGIFVVPSSQVGKWNERLTEYVVPILVNEMRLIDCSEYLYRHTPHEKQAYGGDRSIDSHLKTLEVQYELPDLEGAFIIDDITTTGNIFKACKKLLVEQGIKKDNIYCAAIGGTVYE